MRRLRKCLPRFPRRQSNFCLPTATATTNSKESHTMIYDYLTNSFLYSQNKLFQQAFNFLNSLTANSPCGKTSLAGENLFVCIDKYKTKPPETAKPESHRQYIDIQVLLTGEEHIKIYATSELTSVTAYDPECDLEFYKQLPNPDAVLMMKPGKFAVFFPNDAHMPGLQAGHIKQLVKKAVAKIRIH
jgi:YhcH/YjgK/YiaL family protein